MAIISKWYTVSALSTGTAQENILIDVAKHNTVRMSGFLNQVVIRQSTGSATTLDIQLRYVSDSSNVEDLIYSNAAIDLTTFESDSNINAPFDLTSGFLKNGESLTLYLTPDANCTLEIRLDFEV